MERKLIGKIKHYFPKVGVAVVALEGNLKKGDKIEIERDGEAFEQEVKSMQVEHESLEGAKKGMEVGLKVDEPVKINALVYLV